MEIHQKVIQVQNKIARTPPRQALIVLGMHRSGTSALSGVLAKLGARPPSTLMRPTVDNPRGYWESPVLMRFHDDVLKSAGTQWSDWDRFNQGWIESPVARPFMDRLALILEQEFGDDALFLVKDPRMCRLLPLWLKALDEAGIEPKIVMPVRHPLEVFGSLAVRDHTTMMRSLLIWLRHNLDAEHDSRGLSRCFVRYDDLLSDWRGVASSISELLDLKWPRWSGATEAEIEAYLSRDLRHHVEPSQSVAESTQIGNWATVAYQSFLALVAEGEDQAACRVLTQVKQEFDRTSAIYAPVIHEVQGTLEQMLQESGQKLDAATQALEEQSARHEILKEENEANYQMAMSNKAARDGLREQYQDLERAHASLEATYEGMQAELSRQRQLHDATLAEVDARLQAEIRDIKASRQLAEEAVQERFAEIAMLTTRVFELEAALREAETTSRGLENKLDSASAQNRAVQQELETQAHLVAEYRVQLENIHASRAWKLAGTIRKALGKTPAKLPVLEDTRQDDQILSESKLFDGTWYHQHYPDVRARKMDPIKHYLRYGAKEGRDPGPAFSTSGYSNRYPDVVAAGVNPLVHYLKYGRKEGRIFSAAGCAIGDGAGKRATLD